ncbi:MAG: serine hydrolase domain-containing protein [Clostridia bacterium]
MKNWSKLEDFIEELMEKENIAGVAVAISKKGETIYENGFGYRDLDEKLPITPNTVMGIASISKSFTALEIMRLADEGYLKTDDLVKKHLPDLSIASIDMSKLKIKHLLSHTSGLPPVSRKQDHIHYSTHMKYLKEYETELLGKPGEYFSYANDVFLLLGAIIEKYRGCLYARRITNLLSELEMNNSTVYVNEIPKLSEVTKNYIYDDKEKYKTADWPKLGVYEAGGGVRSNVRDLLKYGQIYVNHGEHKDTKLVSEEKVKEMYTPMIETSPGEFYCYALKATPDYNGVTLVEHGGGQPGVSSNFGFVPEEGLVVAVLTNTSEKPAHAIWKAAVNSVLGLPIDESSSKNSYDIKKEEIEALIGYYASDEGGNILVYYDGEKLRGVSNDEHFTLTPLKKDLLKIDDRDYRNIVKFFVEEDEKAWAAFFGSRMLMRRV